MKISGSSEAPKGDIKPETFTFPETEVGDTSAAEKFVVENTATITKLEILAPAKLSDGGKNFVIVDDGCEGKVLKAKEKCEIEVAFKPETAGVEVEEALEVETSDQTLTSTLKGEGTGGHIKADPEVIEFLEKANGSGPGAPQEVELENTGNAAIEVTSLRKEGPDQKDFQFEDSKSDPCGNVPFVVGAKMKCKIAVFFNPEGGATGEKKAELVVGVPNAPRVAVVHLSGIAVDATLKITPTKWEFQPAVEGEGEEEKAFEVENVSSIPVTITEPSVVGSNSFSVLGKTTCKLGMTLEANGKNKCSVTVRFEPESTGKLVGELKMSTQGPGSTSASAVLEGTGTNPPVLQVTPTEFQFAPLAGGESSAPQAFTVTNVGGSTLNLEEVQLYEETNLPTAGGVLPAEGPPTLEYSLDDSGCTGGGLGQADDTLGEGESCQLDVTFEPTVVAHEELEIGGLHIETQDGARTVILEGIAE